MDKVGTEESAGSASNFIENVDRGIHKFQLDIAMTNNITRNNTTDEFYYAQTTTHGRVNREKPVHAPSTYTYRDQIVLFQYFFTISHIKVLYNKFLVQ